MQYFIKEIKTGAMCVRDSLINKWVNIDYLNASDYTANLFQKDFNSLYFIHKL